MDEKNNSPIASRKRLQTQTLLANNTPIVFETNGAHMGAEGRQSSYGILVTCGGNDRLRDCRLRQGLPVWSSIKWKCSGQEILTFLYAS